MNIHKPRLMGVFALLALAAVAIPLLGNRASGTLRVETTPSANVIIDGTVRGVTPLEIDLEPGEHRLALSADGFARIEHTIRVSNGESQTYQRFLALADANNPASIDRVARELGIATEAFEVPSLHRGAGDEVVTAYWPRGRIRKASLTSFRVDVGEAYGDDVPAGTLEFRKGKKVLWRLEEFEPASAITIARIPDEVLKGVKQGDTLTWGLTFESRRHKRYSKTVKVKIVGKSEEAKISRSLEKLEKRKYFQKQEPIVRAMLTAKTLEQRRLHSEALLNYIGILQAFPGSTSPFTGIVTSLRRLDLDDTPMFQVASVFVGGRGGHANGLNVPSHGSGGSALSTGGVGPAARSMALLAPAQQGAATLRPGGYVDVAPGAMPLPSEDDPIADAPSDDQGGGTPHVTPPSDAEKNDGAPEGVERNDGETNPGQGFEAKPGDSPKPDDGPQAPAGSPIERVAQAESATQALRDAIQTAQASGATPEQMQAMHAALTDAERALAEARQLADAAESGNAQAQQRFDDAWTRFEDAQKRANDANPANPPPDDTPAANTPPATMEDALRQLAQSGQASENVGRLLQVLETARTAEEAAVAAVTARTAAQAAVTQAESALRALDAGASQAERDAAAQAVQQARQALEQAEADATTAQAQATQLQGAVNEAQQRFADAAQQAQELMRTE